MEWGIKLKSNREDLFKKRFWTLVGKMIISFTIIAVFFILLKRIIELSDFQWLYDIDSVSYYRSIETFNKLYYNGTVYIVVATLAIIIFLILLYKEIKHMTSYINIISDSSEKLFDGSEEYIDLPPEMKELEVKLNHFRSESIKNKKSAEENEKKKDELIVYLAHDIKTPLTVVIGYLSLLDEIEDMPLEQRKKYIELALNKSYRLEELINELFDIARFNSEKIILEKEELKDTLLLKKCLTVLFLTIITFMFHAQLGLESATVALAGASLLMLITISRREKRIANILSRLEWLAIFFFVGLFILVGGLVETGVIKAMAAEAIKITSGNVTASTMLILWLSAIASAFIDNIPFVATLIPMIKEMGAMGMTNLEPLWWALSLGACLGGNGTLIGASANVVVAGMASAHGEKLSFISYLKIAFPLMILSIIVASIYVYIRYL